MGAFLDGLRAKGFEFSSSGNSTFSKNLRASGVPASADFTRIDGLPRRVLDIEGTPDLTDVFRHTAICTDGPLPGGRCLLCRHGEAKLMPIQSALLLEANWMDGLFGGASVGSGKTLAALLMKEAMASKQTVLLVKAALKHQLLHTDIALYGRHFNMPTPGDGFHVLSYNDLSNPKLETILLDLAPDLFVLDEAQNVRNQSARTRRYKKATARLPHARHVELSGSLIKSSVIDYAHLLKAALKGFAPLPFEWNALKDFALAIDPPDVRAGMLMGPGVLAKWMVGDAKTVQDGYSKRLLETPGVVMSKKGSLGASLILEHVAIADERPTEINTLLDGLYKLWTWNDEEISMAARISEIARQVSVGFYLRLVWPGGVVDTEWLEARNAWNAFVRRRCGMNRDGQDSNLLVANACKRGELQSAEYEAWKLVSHRKEPPKEIVWLSDWFVEALEREAKELKSCVVFLHHPALLTRLKERGNVVFHAGGKNNAAIEATREPIIFASYAHSTGKNLQDRWSQMILAEPPANGEAIEQSVGRLHRTGQDADEVYVQALTACLEHEHALAVAYKMELEAVYAQSRSERKMLIAKLLNWPKAY